MRRDEQADQPFGGPEGSQRPAVIDARELEHPASLVQHHPGRGFYLAPERTLSLVQQSLRLLQPHLPDPDGAGACPARK